MTLAEVTVLARKPTPGWFVRYPDTFAPHARMAWNGKAMVGGFADNSLRIFGNGMSAPYAPSFDDLMADDWFLVEGEGT